MASVRRRSWLAKATIVVGALVLTAGHASTAVAAPAPPDKQHTATGYGGAVASLDPYAAQVGTEILRRGGNAVDAAVATSAALGVTRPYDGSIGGGGFFVIYSAKTGKVTTIGSREMAPAAVRPDVFIDPDTGEPIPWSERRVSGLSIGVPGLVRGWELALAESGTMPLDKLLRPATMLADRGFVVDAEYQQRTEQNLDVLRDFTSSRDTFLTADGQAPQEGTVFRNPDLADTYRLLARHGGDAFYKGELAEAIAETVTNPPVAPEADRRVRSGEMTVADLAGYQAHKRAPAMASYRGFEVYGMGPPSSGGSTVGEALNIVEGYDLGELSREAALHRMLEGSAVSFADRNAYLGDSDHVDVPMTGLLSQPYADERRGLLGEDAVDKPVPAGDPWPYDEGDGAVVEGDPGSPDGSTTHLAVADRHGNVVSYNFTIEQISGSGIAVPGHGFLLNNELTDFSTNPDDPANAPAAGKRPRSSMSPTVVLADGEPVLAVGSPGGARIITTVLQVLVNRFDFGMTLPEAIAAPRVSNLNGTTTRAEHEFLSTPEAAALTARGHQFSGTSVIGNVTGVELLPDGRMLAAAEPVRQNGGSAMVVSPA